MATTTATAMSFTLLIAIWTCYSTVGVSAQDIDQIITEAANSSEQFDFFFDESTGIIKHELDMLYTLDQWREMKELNNSNPNERKKRKAIRPTNRRWYNKIIPYQIYGYFTGPERAQIMSAIYEWNRYTCLSFRPAGSRDRNRIIMRNGGGCSSYVGMTGGAQVVTLARGCRIKRIIVHELGHAVGFHHEQTRPDRDSYVYILSQNVPRGVAFNFQRYSRGVINDHGVPYDYDSVMHYGAYAFSYNGRLTIQTKDSRYQHTIGKSPGLSFRDIKLANLMYNCAGHCSKQACPSGGYRAKDCNCYCPGPTRSQPIKSCSGGGGGGKGGCEDSNTQCAAWAKKGECTKNPLYMLVNCKKSCNKCDGGGGGKNKTCDDDNKHCADWAQKGECQKNPTYMKVSCKKSCKNCNGGGGGGGGGKPCTDENSQCASWSKQGECTKNPQYMLAYCKKSCNSCGTSTPSETCVDGNSYCASWARIGECARNPNYMKVNCKKSCKQCSSTENSSNCKDLSQHCTYWKNNNLCSQPVYQTYFRSNCPVSCNMCN